MGITLIQTKDELKATREFQLHSELRAISLLECTAEREASAVPSELSLSVTHSSEWAMIHPVLRVTVEIRMRAKSSEEFLSIVCRHLVEYDLDGEYEPGDGAMEAFANGNAVFNVWPYARELFTNLTNRMGVLLPPLPFLRVTSSKLTSSETASESGASESKPEPRRSRKAHKQPTSDPGFVPKPTLVEVT